MLTYREFRVKLPKTFLAVNLSEAFTFQEKERRHSEADVLQMKDLKRASLPPPNGETLPVDPNADVSNTGIGQPLSTVESKATGDVLGDVITNAEDIDPRIVSIEAQRSDAVPAAESHLGDS